MSLREAGVELFDCDHRTPAAVADGVPYVAIPQLRDGRVKLSEARRISQEDFVEWTRKTKPTPGDIVLSRRCNPGETAVVPANTAFALGQNLVLLRANGESSDPGYLRWVVRSPAWWDQISKFINVGAVFESLRCKDIPEFMLPFPPVESQREIARVLNSLDSKIELLHEQNDTLESLARTIFKSWFVDFDPVRAKAEGREPEGMDATTAALFPSSLTETERGSVPEGWSYQRAGDMMMQSRISVNPSRFPEELFAHFSLPAFDDGKLPKIEPGGEIKSNKTIVHPGSVLLSKLNPHIPRIWLPDLSEGHRAICSTEFMVMVPNTPLSAEYLFCQFSEAGFAQMFGGLTTGTSNSHQRVKVEYLMEQPLLHPGIFVLEAFTSFARPLFRKMNANIRLQHTLAELRDTLLPRLISGKLRVPEAEKLVEAVL